MNREIVFEKLLALFKGLFPDDAMSLPESKTRGPIQLLNGSIMGYAFLLQIGKRVFHIRWASTSSTAAISRAIQLLKQEKEDRILVIAVPFMGSTGEELCKEANVNWIDLSGNASIKAPDLLIDKRGNSNEFIKRGRPPSVFAPKSSRVIRWILLNPDKPFTNTRLVAETGADAGHISRILKHLLDEGYISYIEPWQYRLKQPELLLADWRADYDYFKQNEVLRGHIPTRKSEELVEWLARRLSVEKVPQFAVTGLAAAWLYSEFVTHRLVTVYLKNQPSQDLLRVLQFREEPRGANVWLAVPKDEGVFMGTEIVNGIPCVSRLQTYLDLKDQPERADEAAEELKRTLGLEKRNG